MSDNTPYGYIYKISNLVNTKVYIGKTTQPVENRLKQHLQLALTGKHQTKLHNAIRKHSVENFRIELVVVANDEEQLNNMEINQISQHNSFECGYNSTIGGDGGVSHNSVESCSIPVLCLTNDKVYKNCREAGRELNLDYKLINQVCRGHKRTANGYIFEYDTVVVDDILDFRQKRSKINIQNKKTRLVNFDTGEIYANFTEASKQEKISEGTISNHCYKLVKKPRFGFFNIAKALIIGDYHCQVSNLKDSEKLMQFIIETAETQQVDAIFFMGDQMHTHAVIRVEVQDFWHNSLRLLSTTAPTYLLVGNHDMRGNDESTAEDLSSMNVFDKERGVLENIFIINKPTNVENIGLIPYRKKQEHLLKDAQSLFEDGCVDTLFAHQNFTVPLYSDMIDPNLIPQSNIITGHIHEQKQIGKVFQVGSPKWDTLTDANEDKGIWVVNFDFKHSIIDKEFISTKDIVTPIYKHVLNEGGAEPELVVNAKNFVELVGKSAWINKMKKKYKGIAQIKTKPTDQKNVRLMEKGNMQTINDFLLNHFVAVDGVSKVDIKNYLESTV